MTLTTDPSQPPRAIARHRHRRRDRASEVSPSRWGPARLRVRNWRVRTKLVAVLTIPAIGFLVVTGLQTATSVSQANELSRFAGQVALGREVTALVHQLQRERDRSAGILGGLSAPDSTARNTGDLAPDRTAVDRAAAEFRAAARPLLGDVPLRRSYQVVDTDLNELGRVRDGIDAGWLRQQAAFDAYSRTISDLLAILPAPATVGGDAQLGRSVRAFANLARAKELDAQIRGRIYAVCSAASFSPGEYAAITDLRAQQQAAFAVFRTEANPQDLARYDSAVSGQAVRNASRLENSALADGRSGTVNIDAQQWWQASTTQLELIRGAEVQLLDSAIAGTTAASRAQWTNTLIGSLVAAVLLILALLASLLIGRSMAQNLRSLRAQALAVAQRRLPEAIEQLRAAPHEVPPIEVDPLSVQSSDEIGEVADAFTAVHRSAVLLATEQARMRLNVNTTFVNLARRSQTLVERQLRLLDTLEAAETDPDQLSHLFQLDHLATRMRRNDENLLVLAGEDSTRRWSEPVVLSSVILAAVAEIEHYTRIRHDVTDAISVVGHAVADLVHLIAEILENATLFSPPDTAVTVLGWALPEGGASLLIQDEGIGLSADVLHKTNERLAAPVNIDVATSERMGLVVVGHLAARHGIEVRMRHADPGVAVLISLPPRLLMPTPAGLNASMPALTTTGSLSAIAATAEPIPDERTVATVAPDAARTGSPAQPEPVPAQGRRQVRAEQVLGSERDARNSIWWSRTGGTTKRTARIIAPRKPVDGEVNEAGLPVRVPLAHLPQQAVPAMAKAARPAEPDPDRVGSVLSSFYGGIHRAAAEDERPGNDTSPSRGDRA